MPQKYFLEWTATNGYKRAYVTNICADSRKDAVAAATLYTRLPWKEIKRRGGRITKRTVVK